MTTDVERFISDQSHDLLAMQILDYRGKIVTQSALIKGQRLIIYTLLGIVLLTIMTSIVDRNRANAIDTEAVSQCLAMSGSETIAAWTSSGCRRFDRE